MAKKIILLLLVVGIASAVYASMSSSSPVVVTEVAKVVEKIMPEKHITVLFIGDMMFDRSVRVLANRTGYDYILGPASTTISQHDLAIANLEGPITSYASKLVLPSGKATSGFQFTFDTKVADALQKAGIDIVSLANNHTQNFGQDGIEQTRKILPEKGIQYFGSPVNTPQHIATSTCVKDICIGVVGWNEFGYKNDEFVISKIKEMKSQNDFVAVYPHWGIEYQLKPNAKQKRLAREWIDAGADVIIGAHPHVVQTVEVYKDKYIFYSLGNFVFDQYFSFNTTHGFMVSADIYEDKVTYKIIPTSSVGHHVTFPNETNKNKLINILKSVSEIGLIDKLL